MYYYTDSHKQGYLLFITFRLLSALHCIHYFVDLLAKSNDDCLLKMHLPLKHYNGMIAWLTWFGLIEGKPPYQLCILYVTAEYLKLKLWATSDVQTWDFPCSKNL